MLGCLGVMVVIGAGLIFFKGLHSFQGTYVDPTPGRSHSDTAGKEARYVYELNHLQIGHVPLHTICYSVLQRTCRRTTNQNALCAIYSAGGPS